MKNSTELIAMAREIVQRELERSIEKGKQPSFYECIYEAYMQGLEDASQIPADTLQKAQDWHYIELEGIPDGELWLLCEFNGMHKYQEAVKGYYDYDNEKWYVAYSPRDYDYKVLAWHKLPDVPDDKIN